MAGFKALVLARGEGGVRPSWQQLADSDLEDGDDVTLEKFADAWCSR
jgi:hypothetical protein